MAGASPAGYLCAAVRPMQRTDLFDMEVIVRGQDHPHCASITCMIRHYVARRAQVIEDHPHNAAIRAQMSQIS